MVYGASGFSGRAIATRLCEAGRDIVLGGRSSTRLLALARPLNAPYRVFDLKDPAQVAAGLAGVEVVVNAAGPFVETAGPMIEGCIRAGAHYLDLSGEWPGFDLAQRRAEAARAAGVMLMPGVGFTIVASDCLMALAARQVPDATLLRVAVALPAVVSRGTFRTFLALSGRTVIERRHGELHDIPVGRRQRRFNYGAGQRMSVAVSWPDVITGQHTTGVANIETYLEAPAPLRMALLYNAHVMDVHGERAVRRALLPLGGLWPEHPSAAAQGRAMNAVVVETVDPWRRVRQFGLQTLDGYSVTTLTATAIVERVQAGEFRPGFQTPGGLYGADLLRGLGCAWDFDASPLAAPVVAR